MKNIFKYFLVITEAIIDYDAVEKRSAKYILGLIWQFIYNC